MKEEILILRDKGYTYRQIASEIGISATKVSNILNDKFEYNKGWRREKAIELRKSGMKCIDIAKNLGISVNVVSSYVSHLGAKTKRDPLRRNEIIRLSQLGFDNNLIALNLGVKSSTVYHLLYKHGSFGVRYEYDNSTDVQLCQGLFIDGYSNEEISMMTGLRISEVKKYTKGCKVHKIKVIKMKPIKKIKKEIVPHEVARDYLGKGFEKGEMPVEVVLNPERDKGRSVTFLYSDFSNNPTVRTTIMVRDESVSDDEAVERWCKKLGKKSWKLIK